MFIFVKVAPQLQRYASLHVRFHSQELLPLWGHFILVLMGATIMSVWPQGTTYAPYRNAYNPSRRERNEYARTAAGDDELCFHEICWQFTCVRLVVFCSSAFRCVLCMFVARHISQELVDLLWLINFTDDWVGRAYVLLLCIFLGK